jgi:hypothetical protein
MEKRKSGYYWVKYNRIMHPFTVLALPKRYFSVVSAPQPQRKRNICDFLPPIFIKN